MVFRILLTLVLSFWALTDWTLPALSQACPVPTASPPTAVPMLGPMTAPPPMPTDCGPAPPPPPVVNGACGTASGTCPAGTPTAVAGDGSWQCVGSGGGSTATCTAPPPPPPPPATVAM